MSILRARERHRAVTIKTGRDAEGRHGMDTEGRGRNQNPGYRIFYCENAATRGKPRPLLSDVEVARKLSNKSIKDFLMDTEGR